MTTETGICNLALSHLGVAKTIADLTTERSVEAGACRAFYETSRDEMLRDGYWPFAKRIVALALVESAPNDLWAYSYRYPADCKRALRIPNGSRVDTEQTKVQFDISSDATARLIFCDLSDAELEYTALITDTSLFDSDFIMALSLRLATYIAPRVTAGDAFKLGDRSRQLFAMSYTKAMATHGNETVEAGNPSSEFERARQ